MRYPNFNTSSAKCALALVAVLLAFPTAGAIAGHFHPVKPALVMPSAEAVLFCSPYLNEMPTYTGTQIPSAEDYLLDQLFD